MSARASILPVFVPHLGCHHACVFCDQRRITGVSEPVGADTVRRALDQAAALPADGKERQLAFYGGSFTAVPVSLQNELLASAREGIERGIVSSIRLSTRPDAVNEETLARLLRYGVETIELGAQSMDDEVLRLSGRGHTAEDVRRAARLVKKASFSLILQMMTGLPGDTPEKSLATARELIALRPDGVRIYPTVVIRGTELYELWRSGRYREHAVDDAVALCAQLLPLFKATEIPVIRLGLNPTEELSCGEAVAGAYHPALGELVRSRILLDRLRAMLSGVEPGSRVSLRVPARLESQVRGQSNANIRALCAEFSLSELKLVRDPDPGAEIGILSIEKC